MSIVTATVEVLTAEVRTLMVGSRQVTMSVFRQLDEVDRDDMKPFGRVRVSGGDENEPWLVGVDVSDGTLVKHQIMYSANIPGDSRKPIYLPGMYLHSPKFAFNGRHMAFLVGDLGQIYFEVYLSNVYSECECDTKHTFIDGSCESWVAGEVARLQTRWRSYIARYRSDLQLPLIVLAGLR